MCIIILHYLYSLFFCIIFVHCFFALFLCIIFLHYVFSLFWSFIQFRNVWFFFVQFYVREYKIKLVFKKINELFDSKNSNIFFEQFVNQVERQFISRNVRFVIFAFKTLSFRITIFQIHENYLNLCLIDNDNYVLWIFEINDFFKRWWKTTTFEIEIVDKTMLKINVFD